MILYWFFFSVVAVSCFFNRTPNLILWNHKRLSPLSLIYISLFLIIGLRFETGGDWSNYLTYNQQMSNLELLESFFSDPGYDLVNWLGANLYGGVFLPNLLCAAIFCSGLKRFCDCLPNPSLGLIVALPYLVWIVGLGYTRQAAAIGGVMWAISFLREERSREYLFFSVISCLFHKTAILLLPFAISLVRMRSGDFLLLSIVVVLGSITFFYADFFEKFIIFQAYFRGGGMESRGAFVRILMTTGSAIGCLFLISRFRLSDIERRFWKYFSVAGLLFFPLFFIISSTTAVDRLALYWLPLQVFFLGYLPAIFSIINGNSYRIATVLVIFLSAAIQWTWFLYGDSSHAWIPYRFYPWEWFWSVGVESL